MSSRRYIFDDNGRKYKMATSTGTSPVTSNDYSWSVREHPSWNAGMDYEKCYCDAYTYNDAIMNDDEPEREPDSNQNEQPVEVNKEPVEDGYTVCFTIKEIEEIDLVDRQEVKRRKTSDIRLMKKKQKKETIITLGFGGIKNNIVK